MPYRKTLVVCMLLTVACLLAPGAAAAQACPERGSDIPVTYAESRWILHVPAAHEGPVVLQHVSKPAGVQLLKKETPLPHTHADGVLTIDLTGIDLSKKPVDVAVLWPENRWEKTIKGFEEKDLTSAPPKDAVLFVGSSSIVGWDVEKCFPDLPTINRGFGGSQFVDAIRYADRVVVKYKPKAIVIYDGDNDVAGGKSAEWVLADCKRLVGKLQKALPDTPIFVLAIKTSKARWKLHEEMRQASGLMEAYAKDTPGVTYMDADTPLLDADGMPRDELFRKDQLHLLPAGYAVWTDILTPMLKEVYK